MYPGGPSLCLITSQVVDALWLALMVTSYIVIYLVGYHLVMSPSCP